MKKKILITKTKDEKNHLTEDIIPTLSDNFDFVFYNFKKSQNKKLFFLLKPFFILKYFFYLKKQNVDILICFNKTENKGFLKAGKILKIKTLTKSENFPPISITPQKSEQTNLFLNLATKKQEDAFNKKFTFGLDCDFKNSDYTDIVLNSFARCLEVSPDLQIICMGDGEGRKKMIWLAKRLGIEKNTWFIGEQENIDKWLGSFNVFINSKKKNDFKSVKNILKASFFELPIIVFDKQNADRVVKNRETGYVLKDADIDQLAQKMIFLFKNRLPAGKMGRAGKQKVLNEFNLDKNIEKWKKLLE